MIRSSVRLGLDGGLQAIERRGQLLLGNDQRGDEPDDVRPGGDQQEPLVHGGSHQLPGRDVLGDALDAPEQTPPADGSQDRGVLRRHGLQSLAELLAPLLDVRQDVVVADVLRDGKAGGAGKGVAAVGAGVVTGPEGGRGVAPGHHGAWNRNETGSEKRITIG